MPAVQVHGTIYKVDSGGEIATNTVVDAFTLLATAKGDLTTAYDDAAGRTSPDVVYAAPGNIGGLNLAPGLYKFTSTAEITGSDLTLTGGANDVWIFQIATALTVGSGKKVTLAGGARAGNIFWQVGSSATLGTSSDFKGTILADQAITMDTSSTMEGRALAFDAGVTFNGSGGSLPTNASSQVITNFIPTNASVFAGTTKVGLSAQASSGLAVTFTVKSGPSTAIGSITGSTNLAFIATGLVSIVASQAGNALYDAAPSVTNTYNIIPPLSAEPGGLEIQVTPVSGSWRLTAPAGYTGQKTGTGNLAAVSAVIGAYGITYGALSGYMLPTNNNQAQAVVAGVTSLFVGAYRQVSTDLAPPVLTATEGTYTNKVQISWPSVPSVTGYEIWRSQTNNIITAVLIVETPGLLYDDTDVVPLCSYYYWGLSKTATQVSPLGLVSMGYASLSPDPTAVADITATDMVYLPVNATNLTTAGTVSFRLGNLGPYTLNSAEVAFDFRIGANDTAMVLLGTDQRAFTLAAGEEQLVILTAQEKLNLVVPATLSGVKQVQVTVRHASTLTDPNLANNKTTAAGMVLVRAAGVNSPGRSVNDYDGDGKSDFALWRTADYLWSLCLSGPRYQSISNQYYAVGDWPVPGDYDGDGVTDVAIWCSLNDWWNVIESSTKQIESAPFFGGLDLIAAQSDFDGDSMTDPAVYLTSDGTWSVAASASAYATCNASLGGIGYQPVVEDYDGDGLADPAIYNRTTGLWVISFSSMEYDNSSWTFGGPDYLPASADYDGDGLVDPAVYAPSTAYWQVLLSRSVATQGVYTWQGGVVGNINGTPMPADYDGDGIADFAVYHQDTGLWELFLSTHGYQKQSGYFGDSTFQPVTE
ncbi:MAG: ice-binding family protein [Kiritimatiellaeota bacterium]|nr:ice-binding family protein [Kiritimatiellota bacterium]